MKTSIIFFELLVVLSLVYSAAAVGDTFAERKQLVTDRTITQLSTIANMPPTLRPCIILWETRPSRKA